MPQQLLVMSADQIGPITTLEPPDGEITTLESGLQSKT
jgi:hypothetical protein